MVQRNMIPGWGGDNHNPLPADQSRFPVAPGTMWERMMDKRMDPEMQAFNLRMEERAAALPPIRLELPFDRPRALTEALNLPLSEGGPVMAEAATAGCRCVAGASSAGCMFRPVPDRIRCCCISMAVAGYGTASTRMTG